MTTLARRPSLAQRLALFREAMRGIWQGPIYSSDPNLREFFGSNLAATGVPVSEGTALTYAAVWSAVNCISGDIAALPLNMYRRLKDGGKEKFVENPLYRLVHDQPNPEMTSIAWRRTIQAHALSWGNGYSEIVRDGSGRPAQLWPITPDRVTPYRRGAGSGLEYRVVNRDGSDSFIPSDDMLHVPGLGFDGVQGYSVVSKARESIGLGMAAERFGETFFGNGATFGGVISYPGARPPELAEKNYREMLNSQHQGVDRAHKFLALYNGAKYDRLGIPPNDAQFLETRKFQISEIARWFNLPPHKLGDLERATHSNIEQQTIDYYTSTLLPWLKVWEQELFLKLVPGLERNIQFFEHVVDGLLRGDSQMRAESFSKQFSTASITPNEIRDAENRNPIAGGDAAFVPLNTIPLHLVDAWFEADIEEKKAKAEQAKRPPPAPAPPVDPGPARDIELLTEARDTARRCAQESEDAKDRMATELAAMRVEWAQAQAQWAGERETFTADLAGRAVTLAEISREAEAHRQAQLEAETRAAEAQQTIARLLLQATALGTDLETAVRDLAASRDQCVAIEADYQRVCGDNAQLTTALTTASDGRLALEGIRAELTETLDATSARLVESQAALETLAQMRAAEQASFEDETQRQVAQISQIEAIQHATLTELRAQAEKTTQDLTTATSALLEARTLIGTLEATRNLAHTAQQSAEETIRTQAEILDRSKVHLSAIQQAIRGTVVDAANRLLAREAERARKAQGSPEKLTKWMEFFYPIHEDFCRTALKPSVRAFLIALGVDISVDQVLDRIVLAHVSESSRQLQSVLQDADVETLAPALERLLRRWETDRADMLADRVLKEAT